MQEIVPAKQYKPRRRAELAVEEQESIVEDHLSKFIAQKEIARRYRVKVQLVKDLISESKT